MDTQYRVALDEQNAPEKYVVIVEAEGLRTFSWQFYRRRDAEAKASAELERMKSEFEH